MNGKHLMIGFHHHRHMKGLERKKIPRHLGLFERKAYTSLLQISSIHFSLIIPIKILSQKPFEWSISIAIILYKIFAASGKQKLVVMQYTQFTAEYIKVSYDPIAPSTTTAPWSSLLLHCKSSLTGNPITAYSQLLLTSIEGESLISTVGREGHIAQPAISLKRGCKI
jgi:hypothetical protein